MTIRIRDEREDKQFYVGVKIVEAWLEDKDGEPGYAVKYPDGYMSWSPKSVFEDAYYLIGKEPSKVNKRMVDDFVYDIESDKLDDKTTHTTVGLITGFTQHETSSCVDPANFDMDIGEKICVRRAKDELWKLLGFVLQWGRFGLDKAYEDEYGD